MEPNNSSQSLLPNHISEPGILLNILKATFDSVKMRVSVKCLHSMFSCKFVSTRAIFCLALACSIDILGKKKTPYAFGDQPTTLIKLSQWKMHVVWAILPSRQSFNCE